MKKFKINYLLHILSIVCIACLFSCDSSEDELTKERYSLQTLPAKIVDTYSRELPESLQGEAQSHGESYEANGVTNIGRFLHSLEVFKNLRSFTSLFVIFADLAYEELEKKLTDIPNTNKKQATLNNAEVFLPISQEVKNTLGDIGGKHLPSDAPVPTTCYIQDTSNKASLKSNTIVFFQSYRTLKTDPEDLCTSSNIDSENGLNESGITVLIQWSEDKEKFRLIAFLPPPPPPLAPLAPVEDSFFRIDLMIDGKAFAGRQRNITQDPSKDEIFLTGEICDQAGSTNCWKIKANVNDPIPNFHYNLYAIADNQGGFAEYTDINAKVTSEVLFGPTGNSRDYFYDKSRAAAFTANPALTPKETTIDYNNDYIKRLGGTYDDLSKANTWNFIKDPPGISTPITESDDFQDLSDETDLSLIYSNN